MKLVVASNNPGKLREFGALLAPLGWETIPQKDLGVPECEEPHGTFVENALAKARHAAALTGLPALADDSGLCAHALGGAPGVHSARYAGEPKSDQRNNEKLVAELADKPDRRAHYVCVLVFVRHADDPQPVILQPTPAQLVGEQQHAHEDAQPHEQAVHQSAACERKADHDVTLGGDSPFGT